MSNLLKAGLLSGIVLGIAAPCSRAVDQKAIDKAIEAGVKALRDMQGADGTWPHREIGATALAGLTLLECGVKPDDRAVLRAADVVRKASVTLSHNYSICLAILFFDRLGDPEDIPLIESLTVRLLAGQTSTGGWNYQCPFVPDGEVRRLQAQLVGRKELAGRPHPPKPGAVKRTAKDLPREIQQQLAMLHRQSGMMMEMGSDNSNTQFATLALWVARRYGLPVESALKRVETRFRTTQHSDGGWGYFDPNMRVSGPMGRSTASMTCAGLLGLAIADGKVSESVHERKPGSTKPARDLNKDANIRRGLLALSTTIGKPLEQRGGRNVGQAPPIPQIGGRTYYFLWSLERVAVALDLKTIGKNDWYAWGAEILLANQQADGSWRGYYVDCGADTCFALLFLKRANLAPDLTAQLTGRVHDPGGRVLKSGELREGVALEKTGDLASGIEGKSTKPSEDGRYPEAIAKNKEPRPTPKPLPEPKVPDKPPPDRTAADKPVTSAAARMADDLASSSGGRFNLLLHNLRIGKGGEFTDALALSIPKIEGDRQQKVREALVERLTRMKETTLSEYLDDEQVELRIAAARAAASKGSRTLIPRLIPLLRDTKAGMAEAAHQALKQLSGQDFGPKPGASRDERVQAARQWLDWWNKQQGK
jgi:hypothetical protein